MREPKGPLGRIADSVSGSLRRRQQDREPRIIVFDAGGHPSVVAPGTPEHAAVVETADAMVRLALGGRRPDAEEDEGPAEDGGPA